MKSRWLRSRRALLPHSQSPQTNTHRRVGRPFAASPSRRDPGRPMPRVASLLWTTPRSHVSTYQRKHRPIPIPIPRPRKWRVTESTTFRYFVHSRTSSWALECLPNPIVTAARDTPSARATSAFVIPSSTIPAHRAHRSGPVSTLGPSTARSRRPSRGYSATSTHVPPTVRHGEPFWTRTRSSPVKLGFLVHASPDRKSVV